MFEFYDTSKIDFFKWGPPTTQTVSSIPCFPLGCAKCMSPEALKKEKEWRARIVAEHKAKVEEPGGSELGNHNPSDLWGFVNEGFT